MMQRKPQPTDGFIEEAFASALRGLTVAGILFDIGDEARIKRQDEPVGGRRNREARQGTATRDITVTGFYTFISRARLCRVLPSHPHFSGPDDLSQAWRSPHLGKCL